eukprot:CAMPEP_0197691074 /NCGR_PEP_ID=MMETSP1338-20131121/109221_1 /TAXON_ID=43686 ORGANISM="Pelagodinium beii, Strain RCC1491" /NCGR_SAMPLE_ID=MMETSP1338 /ASSEMBLY_ACC=CAM_ASM_000754 /LENGTH=255 /DNA_ID=CAMNT_0043273585 /DNA_START=219 /DNA_END=983 /DNA_ORIENTATION=-
MATAVSFAEVLLAVQQQLTLAWQDRDLQTFEQAMLEVPMKLGHDIQSMGLSFAATIPARHWIGRELWTPRFGCHHQLQHGLNAWKRLHSARVQVHAGRANRYSFLRNSPVQMEKAWTDLRKEYIDIWVEAGKDRRTLDMNLARLELRCSGKRSFLRPLRDTQRPSGRRMASGGSLHDALRGAGSKKHDAAKDIEGLLRCWSRVDGRKRRRTLAQHAWSSAPVQPSAACAATSRGACDDTANARSPGILAAPHLAW